VKDIIFAGAILFVFSFYLSLFLTRVVRKISIRRGFLDKPGRAKLHTEPKPLGGGIAIFLGVFIPLGLGGLFAYLFSGKETGWLPVSLSVHLEGVLSKCGRLAFIATGGLIIFLLGLHDDIKALSVRRKLFVTIVVAAALALAGVRVSLFIGDQVIGGVITVLWIVGLTHVFNLLDNMDGLCASVGLVLSVIFLVVAIQTGQLFVAAFLVVLMGALLGFLRHNFPPAKIFMGDGGSLFVGYILAVITVVFTFFDPAYTLPSGVLNRYYAVLVPLLVFAVPLFDTASVIFIRIREKRPIFKGDRCHFSHRLLSLGMTTRGALFTVCLATFCTGISAVLLYRPHRSFLGDLVIAFVLVCQALGILAIIVLLERAAATRCEKK